MNTDRPVISYRLLVGACLALSCYVAYQLGSRREPSRPDGEEPKESIIEGLEINGSNLDFGEAWEQRKFSWKLPIRNKTGRDINVLDFAFSCGCIDIEPKSLTIPAKQEREIELRIDLTQQRGFPNLQDHERPFAVGITPIQDRRAWPRGSWGVYGIVKSRVTLDKLAINFGDSPVSGEPPVTQTAVALVHIPAEMLAARYDSNVISVAVRKRESPLNDFDVEVGPKPTLQPGPFNAELNLDVVTPTGERLPGLSIPLMGTMQPEIRILPARLILGLREIGKVAEADVVLQAPDREKIIVDQIQTSTTDVDVRSISVENVPSGRAYRVTQKVIKEGDQRNLVTFKIRRGTGVYVVASMEVCCQGVRVIGPRLREAKGQGDLQ
jgi:hypothetical protein